MTFYRLGRLARRYNHDLTPYEYEKCKNDTFLFVGDDCITKALDFLSRYEGEERKKKSKMVEYNSQLHVHNCSGFDTWIILNNLPFDKHVFILLKMEKV